MIDTSQSVSRGSVSNVGECNTLTPGGNYWMGSEKRLLLGRERLSLQGFVWPRDADGPNSMDQWPNALLSDLAGNAMSGPCILASFLCFFASIVLVQQTCEPADDSDEEPLGCPLKILLFIRSY